MKVLIIGGAGYIGSSLIQHMLNDESISEVCVYDNLMYGSSSLLPYINNSKFKFIKGDIRSINTSSDYFNKFVEFRNKFDVIIPLAALVGAPLCDKNILDAQLVNAESLNWITTHIEIGKKIIYLNSNSGYGTTDGTSVITEKDPLNPISLYGKTKCKGEEYVRSFPNHVCFRLATVFGSSLRLRTDLLVNNLVLRAMKDKVLIVYEGKFMRNYVHVQDVCRAVMFAIHNWDNVKNEVYNLGNDEINMSKLDLCQEIKKQLPVEIIQAEYTQDTDKRNYIISSQKFYDKGFKCNYSLEHGIKELVKTYELIWDDFIIHANY